jgi:hypothetical protein
VKLWHESPFLPDDLDGLTHQKERAAQGGARCGQRVLRQHLPHQERAGGEHGVSVVGGGVHLAAERHEGESAWGQGHQSSGGSLLGLPPRCTGGSQSREDSGSNLERNLPRKRVQGTRDGSGCPEVPVCGYNHQPSQQQ